MRASIWLALFFLALTTTSAHAEIMDAKSFGDIVYFIEVESTQLKRYSLSQEIYLSPIELDAAPKGFHVDDSALFVSYGTSIQKMDLDGNNAVDFRTTSKSVDDIESMGNILYLASRNYIQSVDIGTGEFIDEIDLWYSSAKITTSTEQSAIFLRSSGISPSDIYRLDVDASGSLDGSFESPYHGDYPGGSVCYMFPGNRVADNSGTIYNAADLTYSNSLGGGFADLKFWNELPIVLRGQSLYSYNKAIVETGSYELGLTSPKKIAIYNDKVFAFPNTLDSIEIVAINELDPANPSAPIDPSGLAYTPDATALDDNGDTLYLLSRSHLNIFRWSVSQERYLDSISLAAAPQKMAYSAEQERIYLIYAKGVINYVDLETGLESEFAQAPTRVDASVAAGDYLVVSGSQTFRTYDRDGLEKYSRDLQYPTSAFAWSDVLSRIYYISGYSPADLHYQSLDQASGELGPDRDSPYHNSIGWSYPIRFSETGSFIALRTGRVVDAETMTEQAYLGDTIYYQDLTWLHGNVFTLRGIDSNTVSLVERWQPDYQRDDLENYETVATPLALIPLPRTNTLLLLTQVDEVPQFTKLSYNPRDFDGDNYADGEDALPNDADEWNDFDHDLVGDNSDTDDDNDGYADTIDAFPFNSGEWLDTDGDNIGDNADDDDDNDEIEDNLDAFPKDPTESEDSDNDGTGNNADTDDDNDGIADLEDIFPLDSTEWSDTDEDGIGDNADTDDDNDGVEDSSDAYPHDSTRFTIVADDFLPLIAGNNWYYSSFGSKATTVGNAISIGAVSITPIVFPSGNKLYLKASGQQIQFYGINLDNLETGYGTFDVDIRSDQAIPLLIDGNSSGTGEVNIEPTYGNKALSWSATTAYYGSEVIAVEAGEYETLHCAIDFRASTNIDGQEVVVYYQVDIWFAEDVGIVRFEEQGQRSDLTSSLVTSQHDKGDGVVASSSSGGGSLNYLLLALLLGINLAHRTRVPK